jgi:signal transduction histidine kinase
MGIGLYLVRSIARAHGGEVHYEETRGGGATFVVLLPGN